MADRMTLDGEPLDPGVCGRALDTATCVPYMATPRARVKVDRTRRVLTERQALILQAALLVILPEDHDVEYTRRWFWWEIDTYAPMRLHDVVEAANRFHLSVTSGADPLSDRR